MISSTNKNLNMTAPCNTFSCTRWSKFPNCLTIRQKTYKTLMKMTPFLSHWEEQRHLLVWVGLGWVKKQVFGDRIPIGKLLVCFNRPNRPFNILPTSTGISYGYPIDVSCDPVGYPSWMSYGCLQDVLMSSPMDVKRVYP
jgi:hypothetical protein